MPNDNFNPTVDLRKKTQNPPRPSLSQREGAENPPRHQNSSKFPSSRKGEVKESLPFTKGEVRRGSALPKELEVDDRAEFQKIRRPEIKKISEKNYRSLVVLAAVLVLAFAGWWFWRGRGESEVLWYMVKLSDGETFYGQIADTAADPVIIENVYYDYDQLKSKDGEKPINETANIRLVKRGKETHGPSGSLNIVRLQVLYMEPLTESSKVLKAILEYEKQNQPQE